MRITSLCLWSVFLLSGCGGDEPCGDCNCGENPAPVSGTCVSNADCREPTSVCDRARGECVQCLLLADCGHQPGTVCSAGACVCPGGATWCGPDLCVDLTASPDHCGACGHACYGACADGRCVDPWEPVATEGAPTARMGHVAVWTGTVMIVWGGTRSAQSTGSIDTGGTYDPTSRRWVETTIVGAPSPRMLASAVWTGSEMLVWGGKGATSTLDDGAAFDPAANTWRPMSTINAPTPRLWHPAVWTGSEMVVFGGRDAADQELASGGAYDPVTDTWRAIAAPGESRALLSAVWAAELGRMLIYGGFGDALPDNDVFFPTGAVPGGRAYDPVGDAWTTLSLVSQPPARAFHTAVWTGTAMLVFGGLGPTDYLNSGGRYQDGGWTALPPGPSPRRQHTAVWLGDAGSMVVWGGTDGVTALPTGAAYSPSADAWTPVPTALSGRALHTAVSTGRSMIVWGGVDAENVLLGDGGVYTP